MTARLRAQKISSANAPQLAPRGMRSPYLGESGHQRATVDAKAEIQTQDNEYLKKVAKDHNDQIDTRLDAQRENQPARGTPRLQPSAAERSPVTPMRPCADPTATLS